MNVHKIEAQLERIMRVLDEFEMHKKEIMHLEDAALYLGISKSTLYKLTCSKRIPFYRSEGGKLIYFKRSDLEAWMVKKRESTIDEIKGMALTQK